MLAYPKLRGRILEEYKTIKDFAKKIGMTYSTLFRKMNGEYPFTVDELFLICDTLEIPSSEIRIFFERKVAQMHI